MYFNETKKVKKSVDKILKPRYYYNVERQKKQKQFLRKER